MPEYLAIALLESPTMTIILLLPHVVVGTIQWGISIAVTEPMTLMAKQTVIAVIT